MKKKSLMILPILLLQLVLCMALFGCSSDGQETDGFISDGSTVSDNSTQKVTLYYTDADGGSLTAYPLELQFGEESTLKYKVDTLINLLSDPSLLPDTNASLVSLLPKGIILHVVLETDYNGQDTAESANTIRVEFSSRYPSLSAAEKLMIRTGLSQSLFSLPGINRVDLCMAQGEEVVAFDQILSTDRMIINQYDEGFYRDELKVVLYFAGSDGQYLVPEERVIRLGMTESLSMGIVRSLIEGPQTAGLQKTLPEGTKINDISVEEGVCYIDLNATFQMNHGGGETAEKLTIYSLVNSLGRVNGIDYVQILIDGKKVPVYKSYVEIDRFLEPDSSIVQPAP